MQATYLQLDLRGLENTHGHSKEEQQEEDTTSPACTIQFLLQLLLGDSV